MKRMNEIPERVQIFVLLWGRKAKRFSAYDNTQQAKHRPMKQVQTATND